ncbi:hypothetical protein BsWGS_14434 [Bradybaena similaris]
MEAKLQLSTIYVHCSTFIHHQLRSEQRIPLHHRSASDLAIINQDCDLGKRLRNTAIGNVTVVCLPFFPEYICILNYIIVGVLFEYYLICDLSMPLFQSTGGHLHNEGQLQ